MLGRPVARQRCGARPQRCAAGCPPAPREADYDNGFDAYFGNQCADTEYPEHVLRVPRDRRLRARGSRFGPYWWWFNNGCADWPVAPDRYTGPWTARTSAPVLVVGNFFDGVTDYAGAVASSRLLRNSRLLSYAGWGHTAYGRSECTTEYIDAYLVNGTLAAGRDGVPRESEPVPRRGRGEGGREECARGGAPAELAAPAGTEVVEAPLGLS